MKPIIAALTIFNIVCLSLSAQLLPVKSALQTDIANVIHDYPNGFRNITGEEIINNPKSTEFGCKTSIQEASKCRVIKYTSSIKEIYSWEAEMMRTEDFDEASKKFK